MKFEITVLGSGSALPTLTRRPSSHFVNCNERYILIDCGEGTQLQLRKYKLKFQRIDVICITHLHGDHFFGLVGLLSTMHLLGREKKLTIICPEGLEPIIRMQLEIGGGAYLSFEIEFNELNYPASKLVFEDNVLEIHCFPLKHRVPTHGFLIQEKERLYSLDKPAFDHYGLSIAQIPAIRRGEDIEREDGTIIRNKELVLPKEKPKSYAYCSDTIFRENLTEHVSGVDLMYHEATFLDKDKDKAKKTYHTTAAQAGQLAKKAQVKKLLIGHFSTRYLDVQGHIDEAGQHFENVEAAEEGKVIRI